MNDLVNFPLVECGYQKIYIAVRIQKNKVNDEITIPSDHNDDKLIFEQLVINKPINGVNIIVRNKIVIFLSFLIIFKNVAHNFFSLVNSYISFLSSSKLLASMLNASFLRSLNSWIILFFIKKDFPTPFSPKIKIGFINFSLCFASEST